MTSSDKNFPGEVELETTHSSGKTFLQSSIMKTKVDETRQLARKTTSGNYTILLVDDEESILKAIKRVFADDKHKILLANNADMALNALIENKVDLIISDYRMPGKSGTELLKIVKDKYPHIIRLMLTGFAETTAVMEAVDAGIIYKFITKPWNDEDLKLNVRLALAQHELIKENHQLKNITRLQQGELSKLKHYTGVDRSTLGGILVSKGLLTPAQFETVEKYRQQQNIILAKALTELGMIEGPELIRVIQNASKADFVVLSDLTLDKELARLVPREVCESGCLVPIRKENINLVIAMADPLDLARIEYIAFTTQAVVTPQLAFISEIEAAIKYIYTESKSETQMLDFIGNLDEIDILLDEEEVETAEQLMAKSSAPSAVKMVNTIFVEAIRTGASDIHIEPRPQQTLVRYRIDGILHARMKFPSNMHLTTISRIKILAKMDIAERRIPQDGRISLKTDRKIVDVRVSSMPTISGEKIVCRLLDKNSAVKSIQEIGIQGKSLQKLHDMIKLPQGMVIVTGPTGSGKTTSLYSMMQERLTSTQNFVTIEDPVEYFLENASQVQVREKVGLDFASVLRATLRQDPDVILVGEIRDLETARVAFQAAMTGHLVFTTLHTNNTIATISRLFHIGVEPYLVASAVQGIIAQRLVRTICQNCRELRDYDKDLLRILGRGKEDFPDQLYVGAGCPECDQTGYRGRLGLFEVFQMNQDFRHFLTTNYHEAELLRMAKGMGMKTLLEDGLEKVTAGKTTFEELLRILGPTEDYDYNCKNCGKKIDSKHMICPFCGTEQRSICKKCRSWLEKDWAVCPYCGAH